MVAARRITADATAATLDRIVARRGTAPGYIRCDNGPELTANALRDWCRFSGTGSSYIEPGAPWENPYVESFNGRLRDEFLAVEQFDSLLEAQVLIEDWRIEYNTKRPHSSLGWLAPATYAERWEAQQHAGLCRRTDTAAGSGGGPTPGTARRCRPPGSAASRRPRCGRPGWRRSCGTTKLGSSPGSGFCGPTGAWLPSIRTWGGRSHAVEHVRPLAPPLRFG